MKMRVLATEWPHTTFRLDTLLSRRRPRSPIDLTRVPTTSDEFACPDERLVLLEGVLIASGFLAFGTLTYDAEVAVESRAEAYQRASWSAWPIGATTLSEVTPFARADVETLETAMWCDRGLPRPQVAPDVYSVPLLVAVQDNFEAPPPTVAFYIPNAVTTGSLVALTRHMHCRVG